MSSCHWATGEASLTWFRSLGERLNFKPSWLKLFSSDEAQNLIKQFKNRLELKVDHGTFALSDDGKRLDVTHSEKHVRRWTFVLAYRRAYTKLTIKTLFQSRLTRRNELSKNSRREIVMRRCWLWHKLHINSPTLARIPINFHLNRSILTVNNRDNLSSEISVGYDPSKLISHSANCSTH